MAVRTNQLARVPGTGQRITMRLLPSVGLTDNQRPDNLTTPKRPTEARSIKIRLTGGLLNVGRLADLLTRPPPLDTLLADPTNPELPDKLRLTELP